MGLLVYYHKVTLCLSLTPTLTYLLPGLYRVVAGPLPTFVRGLFEVTPYEVEERSNKGRSRVEEKSAKGRGKLLENRVVKRNRRVQRAQGLRDG